MHVSSMNHSLMPPFVMREAGLIVNDVPSIHITPEELTDETHCIVASEKVNKVDLKIPLMLDGIFSFFPTRKLTDDEVQACEYIETIGICPDLTNWDPYDETYANQEDSMVNFWGNVFLREPKKKSLR